MNKSISVLSKITFIFIFAFIGVINAQESFNNNLPDIKPPYYRVRFDASSNPEELSLPVKYTIWIPPGIGIMSGIIVHQHGCGVGSCKSGLTGAFDLHWQALAKKHHCALLAPSYEQPQDADCQLWCDPRNGSDVVFQKSLIDLGKASGHPELATVPWALWGHSGGANWVGIMTLLHPDKVLATWLRSGAPLLDPDSNRPSTKTIKIPDESLEVPMMLNLGTKEGVTFKGDHFAGVWPLVEHFFLAVRGMGGLIGVAVDPLASHECGNQRYLAIPWLDACLKERLPGLPGQPLKPMPTDQFWLATLLGTEAKPISQFKGNKKQAVWLPNKFIAKAWMQYINNTNIPDTTPPPLPTNIQVKNGELFWEAEADIESGIAYFIIECDGKEIATVPEKSENSFGRPLFQGLQYSDTPEQPLVEMRYSDTSIKPELNHIYRVVAVNTVGLRSEKDRVP